MYHAVVSGQCDDDYANKKTGKINDAHWLTTVNRFLWLCVSTESPSSV